MATKQKMLTAVFQDRTSAAEAFTWLQNLGYLSTEINVLMTDRTRALYGNQGDEGRIKAGSMASEGIVTGGAIGTAIGATLGAIIAAIGIPIAGLGLVVAGPLVAAMAVGGAGAVAGGVVGGLVGLGIPESNVKAYEEALRNGGVVLGVVPHSSEDARVVEDYFDMHRANNIVYV